MKFPIVVFENRDKAIHFLDYKVLIGDKRLSNNGVGFKNVEIIDSAGYLYKVESVTASDRIRLLDSIRLMGLMVELTPNLSEEKRLITLSEFKQRIIRFIEKDKSYFSALDDSRSLIKNVEKTISVKEIMKCFIYKKSFWEF